MAKRTPKKTTTKLHYNKAALLKDYEDTFQISMKALGACVALALVFFIALITYLGGWSHEPHKDKYDTFKDRFTIEYEGTKLPYYNE